MADSKSPAKTGRQQESRRQFLRTSAVGVGAVGFSLAGFLPVAQGSTPRLRPPGALDEHEFLAACIKCGQCVQVCPVEALISAGFEDGFGVGAPKIVPRQQACDFSCDVAQCILACPTGALAYHKPVYAKTDPGAQLPRAPVLLAKAQEPEPTLQFGERMGLARLARPNACFSVLGKGVTGAARESTFAGKKRYSDVDRWKPVPVVSHAYDLPTCDLCVRECPIAGAISFEDVRGGDGVIHKTPQVHAACVGCGVCEMMCPAQPAAIVVDARQPWTGGAP